MNIICQKKYTMLFYTRFYSIYTNSIWSLMWNIKILILPESKKSKYYLGTPILIAKLFWIQSVRKNIQNPFILCFGVYTQTQYALLCEIPKFKFYANRKKSKSYLGAPKLKENGCEYSVLEKKNTMPYSTLFWSIYTNSVCCLM